MSRESLRRASRRLYERLPPVIHGPDGVNVVGYFRSELGTGEAGRQVVRALDAVDMPLLPVHGQTIPLNRQGHSFSHLDARGARYPLNLICMNADALPEFAQQVGAGFFRGRYSIGLWFWEVSTPPPDQWRPAFPYVDEVWAATRHVADAVGSVSPVDVVHIPLPIELPPVRPLPRATLDIAEGEFVFLFSFDYLSVFARKNPLALVKAFCAAFPPGTGATLVIKSINGDVDPAARERLRSAAAGRPDVRIIERYLSPEEKNGLTAACDCYVSLHRSEGFGLTMAEAMYLGKPVIATGYSGNVDFMTADNSYLVDYDLVPIGPEAAPYPPTGEWAEPRLEHAAALMREVFDHREEARERGGRGAEGIRRSHSPRTSGERMLERLRAAQARSVAERREAFVHQPRELTPASQRFERRVLHRPVRGAAGKATRAAMLAALTPAHHVPVYSRVLRALQGIDERLALLERDYVGSEAARLRELRAEAASRFALDLVGRVEWIEAQTQAIPFMDGQPFQLRRDPVAGRVLGYEDSEVRARDGQEDYRSFEDVFRGSEELIRTRQRRYLPIIEGHEPVLDFGCGRGELLDLLRDAGVSYLGVDADAGMVARCREKGHDTVVHADGLEYLEGRPDGSLGTIFAAQVIEHLPEDRLRHLLELSRRKLAAGGILIAETVNPHSPPALKTFWVDLSHQQPIFPEVALELCREAGFRAAYVFHPNGTGDVERDRFTQGEFAVVAQVAPSDPAGR